MMISNANIYTKDFRFCKGDLFVSGERIVDHAEGEKIDAEGMYLIPGLIDLHFHGSMGADFCDGTEESLQTIADYQGKCGITAIAPASLAMPEEVLTRAFAAAAAHTSDRGAILCGINMEGPFFAPAKKGAHALENLKNPDAELFHRLQKAAKGLIKLVDIAPDTEGAIPFIREISQETIVSVAHSAADYDTAMAAFSAGASHVTHLYNAMSGFSHREPGILGAAFDSGARVELICDGFHVDDTVLRMTFRLFGSDRIIMISDCLNATGLPDGTCTSAGLEVFIVDGKARLADGTIAGSTTHLFDGMRHAISIGIPPEDAIRAATYNPARQLGVLDEMGTLETGKLANFLLLDQDFALKAVYIKGKRFA